MNKAIITVGLLVMVVGVIGATTGNDNLIPIALGLLIIGIILYGFQLIKKK